jgi:hypothetical protein
MADLGDFDANTVEPNRDFEAIPPGRYEAMIVASEMKPTSAGTGEYLELQIMVISGPYRDALIWDRLNLKNPSEKAVQIARGQLSSICRAVGVLTPRDSTQLHNLPFIVRVEVRDYEERKYNDVKAYYKRGSDTERLPTKKAEPEDGPAKKGAGSAPWSRK